MPDDELNEQQRRIEAAIAERERVNGQHDGPWHFRSPEHEQTERSILASLATEFGNIHHPEAVIALREWRRTHS